jgi:hypothetical protein
LRIECRSGEESSTNELLESGSEFPGRAAPTVCKVVDVDTVDVDDGERLGATLGVCTFIGRVVAKLEEKIGIPERGLPKIRAIPFLCTNTSEPCKATYTRPIDLPVSRGEGGRSGLGTGSLCKGVGPRRNRRNHWGQGVMY